MHKIIHIALGVRSGAGRSLLVTSSIALLLVISGVGGGATTIAHAASSSTFAAPAAKPPPTIWGACPTIDRAAAELKVVRRFDRATGAAAGGATMPAGTTDLLCGNDAYSYYHIVARHYGEWTQKSVLTNENWREIADYAIAEALRNPTSISYPADANTFCYSREISLVDKVRGITVDVMHPHVVVRAQDGAVITAFPTRTPC